jgi:hypothetical protein
MKYKVLLMTLAFLLVFGAGVYAASEINLVVNGEKVTDVEAKVIDGSTYVPLRAVSTLLGAEVGWDSDTKTASVTLEVEKEEEKIEKEPTLSIDELGAEVSKNNNVEFVNFSANAETSVLTYYYNDSFDGDTMWEDFDTLLQLGVQTNAKLIEIVDVDDVIFSVETKYLIQYNNGELTEEDMFKHFEFESPTE